MVDTTRMKSEIGSVNQESISIPLRQFYGFRSLLTTYLQLTKPEIMLLVLVTGATSLVWEGSLLLHPLRFLSVMAGLFLTGGSANALNQYLERDVDARMSRTRNRRPLPLGKITPLHALLFAVIIGIVGLLMFWLMFNILTAVLALMTILFYGLIYTLWLKPSTSQNIVIGGIAGAMAPIGAWAAATGAIAFPPLTIFLIVFFWTPPHFWSLALLCREDYVKVGYPMLPVLKGDKATLTLILWYTALLVIVSLLPAIAGAGWLYAIAAFILGMAYIRKVWIARNDPAKSTIRGLFHYSITYLFALCMALALDRLISPR